MRAVRKGVMIAALVAAMAAAALAQVPTQKKIRFEINVPYALIMGGYSLSPGQYVLYQDSQNPNMFRLYQQDLAREPVAVIYTSRGRYWADRHGNTRFHLDIDESIRGDGRPVLRSFKIAADDPWEIISVKVKDSALMTRVK